ncbi:hypothetical protein KV699_14370 [Vreelandella titanicae]|nr:MULTISPECIES: hypothetical protein [Halomonas]MCD1586455.1 hypothetical protein [Halomonas sp. IOP_14]
MNYGSERQRRYQRQLDNYTGLGNIPQRPAEVGKRHHIVDWEGDTV